MTACDVCLKAGRTEHATERGGAMDLCMEHMRQWTLAVEALANSWQSGARRGAANVIVPELFPEPLKGPKDR
jgi:hypothetical protein